MLKHLLTFALALSSLTFADIEDPLVLAATEGDPSASISDCVNMLTGDLTQFQEDYCIPGIEPISLTRFYISGNGKADNGGWQFFPHTRLTHLPKKFKHSKDKHSRRALVPEPSGATLTYKIEGEEKHGKSTYRIDFEKYGKGITNTSHGIISGRHNLKNQILRKEDDVFTLTCANGTTRVYTFSSEEDRIETFLLQSEHLPNGNWIFYNYDKEGRLTYVKTMNPSQSKIYAWARLHYVDKPEKSHDFNIETSDGRTLEYRFGRYKNAAKEYEFFLEHITNPTRPYERNEYTTYDARLPRFLEKRSLPGGHTLKAEYYVPKDNQAGPVTVDVSKASDDPVRNRVKTLYAPVGPGDQLVPVQHFIYHIICKKKKVGHVYRNRGLSESYDSDGCKTALHFSADFYPTSLEQYTPSGELRYRVSMDWQGHGNLTRKSFLDAKTGEVWARTFSYDDKGNVLNETLSGDIQGFGESSSCEKIMRYNEQNLLVWQKNENGAIQEYTYLPGTDLLASTLFSYTNHILKREFFEYNEDNILIRHIVDDGKDRDKDTLNGITQRHLTTITLSSLGFPEVIEEKYYDIPSRSEHLITKTVLTYSSHAQVIRRDIYDALGTFLYSLHTEYDNMGRLCKETNALGQVKTTSYDQFGNPSVIEDFGGKKRIEMAYDAANRLIESKEITLDGASHATYHTYNIKSHRTSTTDAFGTTTRFTYDPFGNLIATELPQIGDSNLVKTATYDGSNQLISSTNSRGDTSSTIYNAQGKPLSITHPDGTKDRFIYNTDGSLQESIDPVGTRTVHTYDAFGHEICRKIFSAKNDRLSIERWQYNAFHLLSYTPPEGHTITYTYDGAGRKISQQDEVEQVNYTYDTLGRLHTVSTSDGTNTLISIKEYDLLGRVIEERAEDAQGKVFSKTTYTYDDAGNQASVTRYDGEQELHEHRFYDGFNRLICSINALGQKSTVTYNENHLNDQGQRVLQTTHIDPAGLRTLETYDILGRVISVEKKNTFNDTLLLEHLFYDKGGKLCRQESLILAQSGPSRTVATVWEYGMMERLLSLTEAEGSKDQRITRFTYTAKNLLHQTIKPDGIILERLYDPLGRESTLTSSDGSISYVYRYNALNQITKIIDRNTHQDLRREYDGKGRLYSETLPNGLFTMHAYDPMGRRTAMLLPDNSSIHYAYDALHMRTVSRLNKTDDTLYTHHYAHYDTFGEPAEQQLIHDLGTLTSTRDSLGRPTSLTSPFTSEKIPTYDLAGNIPSIVTEESTRHYSYDHLNQLTQENFPTSHNFTYDSHNNRLSCDDTTYTLNDLNELTSNFTYDLNGNPLTERTPTGTRHYTYDALDRLIEVSQPENYKITFAYDGTHRRISKTSYFWQDNAWKQNGYLAFLYDHQNEIGTATRTGQILELRILGASPKAEIGAAVAIELYGETYAPIHDLRGNVRALISVTTGQVDESYQHSAFGEETTTVPPINPWRFSSKRVDPETNLVFFGRRYYHPALGRWLTPDPKGLTAGLNLYAFVNNSPLTHLDLYGLEAVAEEGESRWVNFRDGCYNVLGTGVSYVGKAMGFVFQNMVPIPGVRGIGIGFSTTLATFGGNTSSYVAERHSHIDKSGSRSTGSHRAIMVNGIMTTDAESKEMADFISASMGDMEVFRVYGATHGFFLDILECLAQALGIMTATDHKLMKAVKDNITSLGGTSSGGTIHLIAHSQGGLVVRNVLWRLSAEERAMIEVTTFGTACCFQSNGLKFLQHIVSDKDIAFLFSLPGYLQGIHNGYVNIVRSQKSGFGFDHSLMGPTYKPLLNDRALSIKHRIEKGS